MFQIKVVIQSIKIYFISNTFLFLKKIVVYERIIRNAVQPDRPQMIYHNLVVPTSFLAEEPEFHSGLMLFCAPCQLQIKFECLGDLCCLDHLELIRLAAFEDVITVVRRKVSNCIHSSASQCKTVVTGLKLLLETYSGNIYTLCRLCPRH